MHERKGRSWFLRLLGTAISFAAFGIGGLFLSCALFPLIHLFSFGTAKARRRCRYVVHVGFRSFLNLMSALGVMEWRIHHAERLRQGRGRMIVPNHPSLIDVVLTIAQIPDAYCLVKAGHWRNPFLFGVMRATGYVSNGEGPEIVEKCAELLRRGETLVMFPEGTRSVPNQPLKLQRGAVAIALTAGVEITPVIIRVSPPTLQKGRPWFDVPTVRPVFDLDVHPPMNLGALRNSNDCFSTQARRATRELSSYYEKYLKWDPGVKYG